MENRSPETRRRARANAPVAGYFVWITAAGIVIIGIAFAVVYLA